MENISTYLCQFGVNKNYTPMTEIIKENLKGNKIKQFKFRENWVSIFEQI